MNKQELRAVTLIVKKLGWNDMPAAVAIPAIQRMVDNNIAVGADCCDVIDDSEDTLLSIATWDPATIWMGLFISDYQSLHDYDLQTWATALRYEIESWMRMGYSFDEACAEWDIPTAEWFKCQYM